MHSDPIKIHPSVKPETREAILAGLSEFAALPARRAEVAQAFKNIDMTEEEIRGCGHFKHGERTRFEIAKAEAFIMLAIFWDNMQSPIHDHDESDCGFKVISGEVEETRYKLVEGNLVKPVARRILRVGEAGKSVGESIHKLGVPAGREGQSITLHLYCPILGYDAMATFVEIEGIETFLPTHERERA